MSMQLDDIKRIKYVLKYTELTANGLAWKIGYKKGQTITNLVNGVTKINPKIAIKIVTTYPEIDLNWLLTGEGNFLKKQPDNAVANEQLGTYEPKNENDMMLSEEIKFLKKQLEEKDKQISKLLNLLSLTTSENEEDKKEEVA